jgi:hypothetical protein
MADEKAELDKRGLSSIPASGLSHYEAAWEKEGTWMILVQ